MGFIILIILTAFVIAGVFSPLFWLILFPAWVYYIIVILCAIGEECKN